MPSALIVLLLVLIECINLHQLLDIGQHAAGGQGRGPAGVTEKGIQGRLELMLEYAHEQRAPSLFAAIGYPGANPSPRSVGKQFFYYLRNVLF